MPPTIEPPRRIALHGENSASISLSRETNRIRIVFDEVEYAIRYDVRVNSGKILEGYTPGDWVTAPGPNRSVIVEVRAVGNYTDDNGKEHEILSAWSPEPLQTVTRPPTPPEIFRARQTVGATGLLFYWNEIANFDGAEHARIGFWRAHEAMESELLVDFSLGRGRFIDQTHHVNDLKKYYLRIDVPPSGVPGGLSPDGPVGNVSFPGPELTARRPFTVNEPWALANQGKQEDRHRMLRRLIMGGL